MTGLSRDDAPEVVAAFGVLHRVADAHPQRQHLGGALNSVHHVGDVEWLDEEVVGAELHGFDGTVYQVVGAHHHYDHWRRNLLGLPQHFNAVNARQHDVQQRQVGLFFGDYLQRLFSVAGGKHVVAFGLERAADSPQRQRLVIDNENGVRHD